MLFAPIAAQSIATPKRASLMAFVTVMGNWSRTNDRPTIFRNDGLSESWTMKNTTRDNQLRQDAATMSIAELMAKYDLSRARIYQITNPEGYQGQQDRAKEKKNG